ncbi:MAG: hydrogenase maturation protease [Thermoanaerobaculia bacterium]
MGKSENLLILGLGNLLCGDDGLGVAAVEELHHRYLLPDSVRALDGGTLGLTLLAHFEDAEDVILVDAIQADAPAGSLVRLEGDEVAPAVRNRLSVHQIGVADLLDGLRLLDAFPKRLTLLGLVPEKMELEIALSESVGSNLQLLVAEVVKEAARLGYDLHPRDTHEKAVSGTSDIAAGAGLVGLR